MKYLKITALALAVAMSACKSKPKIIVEETTEKNDMSTSSANVSTTGSASTGSDMHQVTALEILEAERYTYLKVKEGVNTFWIATSKFDAKVGNEYFYRGGLLKTDFESVEHKKVFDKIYLVSEIIDAAAHPGSNGGMVNTPPSDMNFKESKNVPGAIKLSELITQKAKYNGKQVTVSGEIVKANYGIMGKNWYHLQDGTKNGGKICDFTITSAENLPLGANVGFEGKLILNKDFGSGYKYDILMEDAKLK
ncbi:MAG: GW dipeptide domain-containing protein [Leadbetterella sp.]|nr:GW dipeptide domain-containing protein [Leadbetterella sp.]